MLWLTIRCGGHAAHHGSDQTAHGKQHIRPGGGGKPEAPRHLHQRAARQIALQVDQAHGIQLIEHQIAHIPAFQEGGHRVARAGVQVSPGHALGQQEHGGQRRRMRDDDGQQAFPKENLKAHDDQESGKHGHKVQRRKHQPLGAGEEHHTGHGRRKACQGGRQAAHRRDQAQSGGQQIQDHQRSIQGGQRP
jgi:hypothetical protein